jgi:hypothetical protein
MVSLRYTETKRTISRAVEPILRERPSILLRVLRPLRLPSLLPRDLQVSFA